MYINRQELKFKAKLAIRNSNPKIMYAGLIVVALSILISFLMTRLTGITANNYLRIQQLLTGGDFEAAVKYYESISPSLGARLIDFALEIVSSVVSVGFIIFLLNSLRNAGAVYGNLLDGFGMVLRIIALNILEGVFVFLWSLLLFVPGIIAAYRYRMAIYLLIDHPEMSPLECIRESKSMMRGHKADMFVLDLSFIGWEILESIPVVGYAAMIWVMPYTSTVYALYYETLRGAQLQADYIDYGGSDPQY